MVREIVIGYKDDGMEIVSKKFRNKKTGEIVTQFSILDIHNFEEVKDGE